MFGPNPQVMTDQRLIEALAIVLESAPSILVEGNIYQQDYEQILTGCGDTFMKQNADDGRCFDCFGEK